MARALVAGRTPPGRRVILVTNGGGLGILATDAARDAGLDVAPLPASVQARLATVLPPHAATTNPVDLIGDATPSRYGDALHALAGESASLVVMLSPQAATDAAGVARAVLGATREWPAPVLGVFAGGARVRPGVTALEEAGVPCYAFPERAVQALGHTVTLAERRRAPAATLPTDGVDRCAARRRARRGDRGATLRTAGRRAAARRLRHRRRAGAARPLAGRGRRGGPLPRRAGGDQDRVARDHAQDRRRRCRARTRLARGGGERHRVDAGADRARPAGRAPGRRAGAADGRWRHRRAAARDGARPAVRPARHGRLRRHLRRDPRRHRDAAGAGVGPRGARDARRAADGAGAQWVSAAARPSTSRHWPTP